METKSHLKREESLVVFLLKKIIGLVCMPLSIAGLLLLAGLALLLVSRRQKTAKVLLVAGTVCVLGFSMTPTADRLLAPLEGQYPPLVEIDQVTGLGNVVVLGGGHLSDSRLPATGQLGDASLARLVEGVRIQRALAQGRLIFTGGNVFDPIPHARVMGLAALSLGVSEQNLVMLETARDTAEEVLALREILAEEPFVLVTSASHMPRAMRLFEMAGMQPVAAPTDVQVKKRRGAHPGDYFPSAAALRTSERAIYEYLGQIWAEYAEVKRLR